jgi:hypothetical protein
MAAFEPLPLPKIKKLPRSMPEEGAISIVLQEGVPIFRASRAVQERVQGLLDKASDAKLSAAENEELDRYQEVDDYLSHLNRLIRNSILSRPPS